MSRKLARSRSFYSLKDPEGALWNAYTRSWREDVWEEFYQHEGLASWENISRRRFRELMEQEGFSVVLVEMVEIRNQPAEKPRKIISGGAGEVESWIEQPWGITDNLPHNADRRDL